MNGTGRSSDAQVERSEIVRIEAMAHGTAVMAVRNRS